jgi:aldose 1-epimerase
LNHQVKIAADRFVSVDKESIPTGIASVVDTPLDFRQSTTIASRMDQLQTEPIGYDHCFVLNHRPGESALVATVTEPKSGRTMKVITDQPGIQFYTGNYLNGQPSSGGFAQYQAFCLETQALPDSPNQPDFPSTLLSPGQTYRQTTIYRFAAN